MKFPWSFLPFVLLPGSSRVSKKQMCFSHCLLSSWAEFRITFPAFSKANYPHQGARALCTLQEKDVSQRVCRQSHQLVYRKGQRELWNSERLDENNHTCLERTGVRVKGKADKSFKRGGEYDLTPSFPLFFSLILEKLCFFIFSLQLLLHTRKGIGI